MTHPVTPRPVTALALLGLLAALPGCPGQAGGGVPSGLIAAFDRTCPDGWTRYEGLDGRFARGAPEAGAAGGEAEHAHAFDITARTSKDGAHEHPLAAGEAIEVDPGFFGNVGLWKGYVQSFEEGGRVREKASRALGKTDLEGAHDHLISVAGDSEASSSLPPFLDVIYCRKD
jgi:hypothetical protein